MPGPKDNTFTMEDFLKAKAIVDAIPNLSEIIMPGPKTVEEAKALPEVTFLELRELGFGEGLEGDTICAFVDDDRRSKYVTCTERGWVKVLL